MREMLSLLAPFIISLAIALFVGFAIRRAAPRARWMFFGVFLIALSWLRGETSLMLRVVGTVIGIAIMVWDWRRSRVASG